MNVAIFCGSSYSPKVDPWINDLVDFFTKQKHDLVYGGASIGLMGALADGFLANNRKVFGVIPDWLGSREVAHDSLTEMYRVPGMHERKLKMYELAHYFLILPGGFGTLDEFFEILTWKQLNQHSKKIYLFNADGYYKHLDEQFETMVKWGFLKAEHRKLFQVAENLEELKQLISQV